MAAIRRAISSLLCRSTAPKISAGLASVLQRQPQHAVVVAGAGALDRPGRQLALVGKGHDRGIQLIAPGAVADPGRVQRPAQQQSGSLTPGDEHVLTGTTWRTSLMSASARRCRARSRGRVEHPQQHLGGAERDVVAVGIQGPVGLGGDEVVVPRDGEWAAPATRGPRSADAVPQGSPPPRRGGSRSGRAAEGVEHRGPGGAESWSMRPVRETSESSRAVSPPSAATTNSGRSSQRSPARSVPWSRSHASFATLTCAPSGRPVRRRTPRGRRPEGRDLLPPARVEPREAGATARPSASIRMPVSPCRRTAREVSGVEVRGASSASTRPMSVRRAASRSSASMSVVPASPTRHGVSTWAPATSNAVVASMTAS